MDKENLMKPNLTLIEGGILIDSTEAGGKFVMAEVTDTRLMGVLGLHIVRESEEGKLHQFFYIDTEEYGIDDYQSMRNIGEEEADAKKSELFGGLGGYWTGITEKDSVYLVKHYANLNIKYKFPLPEKIEEYKCILEANCELTEDERLSLWGKICTQCRNDNEVINYFIMRLVAKDYEGASHLAALEHNISGMKLLTNMRSMDIKYPGTLLKNEIFKPNESDGTVSAHEYHCVSLIDTEKKFLLVESEITTLGNKAIRFNHHKPMEISSWEVSLILNRWEYIIYGTAEGELEDFSDMMFELFSTVTESSYDFGSLFMIFRKGNDHVKKKTYRLDMDTLGVVCLLDSGEILFAGSDPSQLGMIEKTVSASGKIKNININHLGNYRFPEPMLARFMESDFDRFQDFLEYLQSFQD